MTVPESAAGDIATVSNENSKVVEAPATSQNTSTQQATRVQTGSVEQTVRSYFSDIPVMIEIARCESTFRQHRADGSVLRGNVDSADTGVMQINKRYHAETAVELGLNLHDIKDNMAYARYLYNRDGTQPWNASRPCWGNTLAANV